MKGMSHIMARNRRKEIIRQFLKGYKGADLSTLVLQLTQKTEVSTRTTRELLLEVLNENKFLAFKKQLLLE